MKWILKSLILLPVAAVALAAYAYVLPATSVVEQSIVLQAPPELVITYLHNPTQWENWSVWSKRNDPEIVHMYGGPLTGPGARHHWISDKYGSGKRIFSESTDPLQIAFVQTSPDSPDTTDALILLEKVPAGTRLVWRQVTSFDDSILGRYKSAWHQYKSENELKQGLDGLQALLLQTANKRVSK